MLIVYMFYHQICWLAFFCQLLSYKSDTGIYYILSDRDSQIGVQKVLHIDTEHENFDFDFDICNVFD